ncbi:hypothetical protein AAFO92_17180 [Roseovarius sp. CAU 1744]
MKNCGHVLLPPGKKPKEKANPDSQSNRGGRLPANSFRGLIAKLMRARAGSFDTFGAAFLQLRDRVGKFGLRGFFGMGSQFGERLGNRGDIAFQSANLFDQFVHIFPGRFIGGARLGHLNAPFTLVHGTNARAAPKVPAIFQLPV